MPDFIDNMFNIADSVLDKVEPVLSDPKPDDRHGEWNRQFEAPMWAAAEDGKGLRAMHAFPESSTTALCDEAFESDKIQGRGPLEHGKVMPCCTSCVIAVSK